MPTSIVPCLIKAKGRAPALPAAMFHALTMDAVPAEAKRAIIQRQEGAHHDRKRGGPSVAGRILGRPEAASKEPAAQATPPLRRI